ncbi:hypothetical protein BSA16_14645 [Micromonospora sp. Rc5]|nr:hypothetical protein BSA16_14645 [Micromonospora sp. Rc5]
MTVIRSQRSLASMRSWVTNSRPMPSSSTRVRNRPTTLVWVVTSRAVVHSSAITRAGRVTTASAMATRWRRPPESWWG